MEIQTLINNANKNNALTPSILSANKTQTDNIDVQGTKPKVKISLSRKIMETNEDSSHVQKSDSTQAESQTFSEKETKINHIKRYSQWVKDRICRCFEKKTNDINIDQSQMSYEIQKIRQKQNYAECVLPPKSSENLKTLVLDLDETLIYTQFNQPSKYDFQIMIEDKGKSYKAYVTKRFGLQAFLFQMSKIYEIIVFSASKKRYVDSILEELNSKKWISHVLYQQHCLSVNKNHFLKPLKILGRPLDEIILVDDTKMAGILYPQNFYQIQSFRGSTKDRKLIKLSAFLKHLTQKSSLRPVPLLRKTFQNRQIRIADVKHKIKRKHERQRSDVQLLRRQDENSNNELIKIQRM